MFGDKFKSEKTANVSYPPILDKRMETNSKNEAT